MNDYPAEPYPRTAVQTRCPHCLGEQYVLNVIDFSLGEAPCHLCGQFSREMTTEEWFAAIAARRREHDKRG